MDAQRETKWMEPDEVNGGSRWTAAEERLKHQVEVQSRQIEQVLTRHQVPAELRGGSVRPHWVSFDLVGQLSDGLDRVRRLTGELATALGVPEVRLDREGGRLRLAVKRYEPHPVDLLDLLSLLPEVRDLGLALGLDHQGHPVMLNLGQADLHNILVCGVSGAGKSSLMRGIAVSLALSCRQSQAQMAIIGLGSAPSGITSRPNPLYPVNYLPHLLFPVATTPAEAVDALDYLVQEADYRADNGISSPLLVVMVDDADMLIRRVGREASERLATLMHAPAGAGIRLITAAANPGLPDLARILRHNVDLRLVGRMADERAAYAATGRDDSYAQFLEGKGDFLALSAGGMSPFQAAYIDDYDLHLTLTELHRASAPTLLAQAMDPGPSVPPSWSTERTQSFTYDPVGGSVDLEPDDRSTLDTIEILVGQDEVDGEMPGRPSGSLGDIWATDELATGQRPDSVDPGARSAADPAEPATPAAADLLGSAELTDSGDGSDRDSRAAGHRPLSVAEVYNRPDAVETDETPGAAAAHDHPGDSPPGDERDAGYRMLPFEGMKPGPEQARMPGSGESGEAKEGGGLNGVPGGAIAAEAGRVQALWPVEPVYTEIDDELWDNIDPDEDDWRRRLH